MRRYTVPGRHGYTGYSTNGCRCAVCTEAARQYRARWRQKNRDVPLPADDPRHGSNTTYVNCLCRCSRCLEAHRMSQRVDRG
jgi:hypothetical protein